MKSGDRQKMALSALGLMSLSKHGPLWEWWGREECVRCNGDN